jgi:hypothetical protein
VDPTIGHHAVVMLEEAAADRLLPRLQLLAIVVFLTNVTLDHVAFVGNSCNHRMFLAMLLFGMATFPVTPGCYRASKFPPYFHRHDTSLLSSALVDIIMSLVCSTIMLMILSIRTEKYVRLGEYWSACRGVS